MRKAIERFGYTCVAAMVAAGISGALPAQVLNRITVNLPEPVVVGASTLPAGSYDIQDLEPISGHHVFVFRGEGGKPVSVEAEPIEQAGEPSKSRVVLTKHGSEFRLDKMFVAGSSVGYEFLNGK